MASHAKELGKPMGQTRGAGMQAVERSGVWMSSETMQQGMQVRSVEGYTA